MNTSQYFGIEKDGFFSFSWFKSSIVGANCWFCTTFAPIFLVPPTAISITSIWRNINKLRFVSLLSYLRFCWIETRATVFHVKITYLKVDYYSYVCFIWWCVTTVTFLRDDPHVRAWRASRSCVMTVTLFCDDRHVTWQLSRLCVTNDTFARDNCNVRTWQMSRWFVTTVTRRE